MQIHLNPRGGSVEKEDTLRVIDHSHDDINSFEILP